MFERLKTKIESTNFYQFTGFVNQVIGLTIESIGPAVSIGTLCKIKTAKSETLAEVVGFKENKVLLMPYSDLVGIFPGCKVIAQDSIFEVKVGEELLGRILDGLGQPIDGKGEIKSKIKYPVENRAPNPLERPRIDSVMPLGIKAIDALITIGKGQRVGIFAGSGVGKSTLLGMIARNAKADVNVLALIGERGRELKEFLEKDLKEEGLKRSVVIVATSDESALKRVKAAYVAMAIAEYFRDQGMDVLFMMDSLTRFAMAQREIGLAIGEPPVSRGYTPSVFSIMPKLLERAGKNQKGSITALYTVLVDGDDFNEPITDTARGILDGHIVLSRSIANKNHYPAIDVLASISRVMNDIVSPEHKELANETKRILATYKEAEDLITIGAYSKGTNSEIDRAIELMPRINEFLRQDVDESFEFEQELEMIKSIIS
ncbi:flagellar protein export ATPase FliI [Caldicellulosiruptor sp. DIB 104C]|uniref:flagellar protein export ATPase FliI n=1 Tax=Caldicellulosiruptor sp. DIB 104C TaxID=3019889 RepID=UPI0023068EF6|nr:flagellar protein export ATPase FliI [Caldicellulosiruptor sp. DIB 104C]